MFGEGVRVVAALAVIVGVIVIVGQIVTDPLQALYYGFGSEILGFVTYSIWKINVNKIAGDLSVILLFLPVFCILILIPYESTTQSVNATTDWFVSTIQGIPASILGDIGGSMAAAILGL
jgi:hypothetical protein